MLHRYGGDRKTWLARLIEVQDMEVPSFTPEIADIAADAAERYGRGSRHPARLNFGDCLSYAVAKHLGAPLLYKGDDFRHTDVESALAA
jgi:ribonuclease VapC